MSDICWNHDCTGGGIPYSTSRIELVFLVSVSVNVNSTKMF